MLLALERAVNLMARGESRFPQFLMLIKPEMNFKIDGVQVTCRQDADSDVVFTYRSGGREHTITWSVHYLADDRFILSSYDDPTTEQVTCTNKGEIKETLKKFLEFDVAQTLKRGVRFWPSWFGAFKLAFEESAGKGPWVIVNQSHHESIIYIAYAGTGYKFHVYPAWAPGYQYKVVYQYDLTDGKPFGYAHNAEELIRWIETRFVPIKANHRGPFPEFTP
jgi:hypothetical protein